MPNTMKLGHCHLLPSLLAFVCAVALGCVDGVTGIGDGGPAIADAAVRDLGVADTGENETHTLEVQIGTRHVTLEGDMFVPADVSGIRVEVTSFNGSPPIIGRAAADGLIVVDGVPQGVRTIRVDRPGMSPEVFVGSATRVELVTTVLGRAVPGPTDATTLDITVELASPWSNTDTLEVRSPGTGFFGGDAFGMVSEGATTMTGLGGRWPVDRPLARGASDDDLYLFRFGYERLPDRERFAVTEMGQIEDLRLTDGANHALTATLLPANDELAVDVIWDQSSLFPLGPLDPRPNGDPSAIDALIWTVGADRHGLYGAGVNVVLDFADGQTLRSTHFVTPAPPPGWSVHLTSSLSMSVALPLPAGGIIPANVVASRNLSVEDVPMNHRVPVGLTWATGLSVDGVASWQIEALRDLSVTPTLAWTAPGLGTVRGYAVVLHEVEMGGFPQAVVVGTIYTDRNDVRVPQGVLRAGGLYFFEVVASDAVELDRTPYRFASGESRSSMVSNVFSVVP